MKILEEGRKGTVKREKSRVGKRRMGHSGVTFNIFVQLNTRRKGGRQDASLDDGAALKGGETP